MALLLACSPKLDWRIVQSPQEHYTALFPSKPDKLERSIAFEGTELKQTLEAVKIDEDIYSITSIRIPIGQSAVVEKIIAQLKSNLLTRAKESDGAVVEEVGYYQNNQRQRLPTIDYFISFKEKAGVIQQMRVRWITRQSSSGETWIYQIAVLHLEKSLVDPKTLLSQEQFANFFNEFYPE